MVLTLIKRPWLVWPTFIATLQCSISAEKHFEDSNYGEGEANAYKHTLWNVLIAHNTRVWIKSPQKRVAWAKHITDLHEECFPNVEASKNMDLSNNQLGRKIYLKYYTEIEDLNAWEAVVLKYKNEFIVLT